jgi:phospholipid transport system transporter-binding protein
MMSGHFAIERASPGRLVASGELGFETAARALRQGDELLRHEQGCVIDLARIESGDSAGVAVLVDWLASAKARGGSITYEGIPAQMLAIARISDLEDLLLGR